jgi:hypothetical protein
MCAQKKVNSLSLTSLFLFSCVAGTPCTVKYFLDAFGTVTVVGVVAWQGHTVDMQKQIQLVLIYSMTHNLSTVRLARGLGWRLVPMTAGH